MSPLLDIYENSLGLLQVETCTGAIWYLETRRSLKDQNTIWLLNTDIRVLQ